MNSRTSLPALVATVALCRIAFAAAFPHPPWAQAEKDLRAHWRELRPDEEVVSLKHTDQQHFRSNGHWYEIGYPFDLTLKQPSGTKNVKAEVNYVNKLSSPYVFAGIGIDGPGEDTDQAAEKAKPSQERARDIIVEYLADRDPKDAWRNLSIDAGVAHAGDGQFSIRYTASAEKTDSVGTKQACRDVEVILKRDLLAARWMVEFNNLGHCSKAVAATSSGGSAAEPALDAATCRDACTLLTRYSFDELVTRVCKLCKKYDDTYCTLDFPWNDVPACDAYDELRNCLYARFGYVFAKSKWQKQFAGQPWYKPDPNFTEDKLPPVVKANVQKLKERKARRVGCQ